MALNLGSTVLAALFAHSAFALPSLSLRASSNLTNADTSLTLIYQNNLNASDDVNHVGAIVLDSMTYSAASSACAAIGESLLTEATINAHSSDFFHSLAYLEYNGQVRQGQQFIINDGVVAVQEYGNLECQPKPYGNEQLPVLCTQSSMQNGPSNAVASASNEITITSTGNTYVGFRNLKSFRFVGIPYANPTARFQYSTVYNKTGQTITATTYGPDCLQAYDPTSAENCLYMNIQTPYIPKAGSTAHLKPVLVSIYGGGFTGGNSGPNSGLDSGNLASREDIVGVECVSPFVGNRTSVWRSTNVCCRAGSTTAFPPSASSLSQAPTSRGTSVSVTRSLPSVG